MNACVMITALCIRQVTVVCFDQLQDDQIEIAEAAEEDECMRLLEDTLNSHIDELRAMTDATVKKYIRS